MLGLIVDSISNNDHIWVGEVLQGTVVIPQVKNTRGREILLFDPYIQPANRIKVYLFFLRGKLMGQCHPESIRHRLSTLKGNERDSAIKIYNEWCMKDGRSFFQENNIFERHRRHVEKTGSSYLGTRKANPGNLRIAHCWRCKNHLDNTVDVECKACGWILCRCGACGCGYNNDKSSIF